MHAGFWYENLRKGHHLEDSGVDGKIILKCIFKQWDGGVDWIDMAHDRDMWRAVVKVELNLWVL